MRTFLVLVFAVVVVSTPINIPNPNDLNIYLNEDEFEDYLDLWLKLKYQNITHINSRNAGCTIQVNGDLGQPQPVYIHDNNYLTPTGNTGEIHLRTGEEVTIACVGSGQNIVHPSVSSSTNIGIATCVNDTLFSGKGWIDGVGAFGDLTCSSHCTHEALLTSERCYNNNVVIRSLYVPAEELRASLKLGGNALCILRAPGERGSYVGFSSIAEAYPLNPSVPPTHRDGTTGTLSLSSTAPSAPAAEAAPSRGGGSPQSLVMV
ncbi:hypothetical protein RR46_13666 [Papilio xuthus]|uniref:Uncharacterized protein n=1 Tax=Papilio xuthus TaxID=66420 RepID=A0A194PMU6_PAPXU|nr:hypothetical protein RR46_13666 [Papilio xuthus]